MTFVSF